MMGASFVQRLHEGAGIVRNALLLAICMALIAPTGDGVQSLSGFCMISYGIALVLTFLRWMCRRAGLVP